MANFHNEPVDHSLLAELRNKFLEHYAANPQDYDARDVEQRIKVNDWYTKRYLLLHPNNVDKALEEMKSVYKWRKEARVNDFIELASSNIPIETFKIPGMFLWKPDQNGNLTLYSKGDSWQKWPHDVDEPYYIFLVETADRLCAQRRKMLGMIWDTRNIGRANVDLTVSRARNDILERYPFLVTYAYIVGFPTLLSPILKLLVAMLGREANRNFNTGSVKDVIKLVGEANVPWFMQESDNAKEIRAVPRGLPTLKEIANKRGDAKFEKEADKYEKVISKFINPTAELLIEPTLEAYVQAMVDQA